MNSKGYYTAITAWIVIAMFSAAVFSAGINNNSAGNYAKYNSIGDVKRTWSNTRYLLDKATTDAIADNLLVLPGCILGDVPSDGLEEYLDSTLEFINGQDSAVECSFESGPQIKIAVAGVVAKIEVSGNLGCIKEGSDFNVSFTKEFEFEKKVLVTPIPDVGCWIEIFDVQTSVVEGEFGFIIEHPF